MAKDPSFTLLLELASRVAEDESDVRADCNLREGFEHDGEVGTAAPASAPAVGMTGRDRAQAPSEQSDSTMEDGRAVCRVSTSQLNALDCNSNNGGSGVLSDGVGAKLAESPGDENGRTDTTAMMPGSQSSVYSPDLTAATAAKDNAGLARAGLDSVPRPPESVGIAAGAAGDEISETQIAAKENVPAPTEPAATSPDSAAARATAVISPARSSGLASASPRRGLQQQSPSTHPMDEACDLENKEMHELGEDIPADASGEQVAITDKATTGERKMAGLSVPASPVIGRGGERQAIPPAAWELHRDGAEEMEGTTRSPPQSMSHDDSIATEADTSHVTLRIGPIRDVPRLSASALGIFHESPPSPPPRSETGTPANTNTLAKHQAQGAASSFAVPDARSSLLPPSNETRKSKLKDRRPRALQALADSAGYARASAKAACTTSASPGSQRRGTRDRRRRGSAVDRIELSRRNTRSPPASAADSICASADGWRLDGKRQRGGDGDSNKSKRGSTERSPAPEKRRDAAESDAVSSPPVASAEANNNENRKQRKRRREADMLADSPTFCSPAASIRSPSAAGCSSSERRTRRRCNMEDESPITPMGEGKSLSEKFRPLGTFATPSLLPLSVTSVRGAAAGCDIARSSGASSRVGENGQTNVAGGEDASGWTCLGSGGKESPKRSSLRPNGGVDSALEGDGASETRTAEVDGGFMARRTSSHQQQPPKLFVHAASTAVCHSRAPRHSRTD